MVIVTNPGGLIPACYVFQQTGTSDPLIECYVFQIIVLVCIMLKEHDKMKIL